jgi:hypothetical protein
MVLACSALVATAVAGEAEPWLTVTVADGQRTLERFNSSIYGTVWHAPGFAPLRAKWWATMLKNIDEVKQRAAEQSGKPVSEVDPIAAFTKETGLDPFTIASQFRFLELMIQGEVTGKDESLHPAFRLAFDLGGPFAAYLAKEMAKNVDKGEAKRIEVAGADLATLDTRDSMEVPVRAMRFASQLVVTNAERADWQRAMTVAANPHDVDIRFMPSACTAFLERSLGTAERKNAEVILNWMRGLEGSIEQQMDIVPEGVRSRFVMPVASAALAPVDRSVLARLPANTMSMMALGIDGKAWWNGEGKAWIERIATSRQPPIPIEQAMDNLDQMAKDLGLDQGMQELVSGLKGTVVLALMQSAPIPTALLVLPRSPAMDHLVTRVLARAGQQPPADGSPLLVPLTPLPFSLSILKAEGHWLFTTDPVLSSTWMTTASGGWLDTPAAKVVLEKAGADAWLVAASDNAAEIRMYTGFAAMGLQQVPDLNAEERQSVLKTLHVLAQNAKPGWCTGRTHDRKRTELTVTGLTGGIFAPAIIAAIAIPNLLESRKTVTQAKVAASLRTEIFPAQVQFMSAAQVDQDGDKIGESGFFQELSGGPLAGSEAQSHLLPAAWNTPEPEIDGYRFAMYLPDGQGGAIAERLGARQPDKLAANAQEKSFVVYAWPVEVGAGRVFALTAEGLVYVDAKPFTGEAPQWNDVFGGKGWEDKPTWKEYGPGRATGK